MIPYARKGLEVSAHPIEAFGPTALLTADYGSLQAAGYRVVTSGAWERALPTPRAELHRGEISLSDSSFERAIFGMIVARCDIHRCADDECAADQRIRPEHVAENDDAEHGADDGLEIDEHASL